MFSFFKKLNKEWGLNYIHYSLLGINFKIRNRSQYRKATVSDIRCHTAAAQLHKNLEKYRGIYTDKEIVIVGCGPSISHYKPIKNAVHIGINRAYKLEQVNFEYLFAQDHFPEKEDIEAFINYKPDTCKKFLGLHTIRRTFRIRPSTIARIKNKELYILNHERPFRTVFPIDITLEPFAYFSGTVFSALQFALFTNAKRIYLAGFDCNIGHAFVDDINRINLNEQFEYWEQFKLFKDMYWEDNEIISINPVNLKCFFNNVYTQSFVDEHPELLKENIEILKI